MGFEIAQSKSLMQLWIVAVIVIVSLVTGLSIHQRRKGKNILKVIIIGGVLLGLLILTVPIFMLNTFTFIQSY
jgi:hypothetical protein